MHRRMDTRRIPARAKTRTHQGKQQAQLNIGGIPTWCDLLPGGRARVVRPEWYASLRMADGTIQTVKLVKDKQSAELLLAKMQLRQNRIKAGIEFDPVEISEQFSQIVARFWADRARALGGTSEYLNRSKTRLASILSGLGVTDLDQVKQMTEKQIQNWIDSKSGLKIPEPKFAYSAGTINQYLIPLEMFFKWLHRGNLIARVPEIPSVRVEPKVLRRALTQQEVNRLEATAPWPRGLFYALSFSTLARKSALLAVRATDVHLDDPAGPWMMLQRKTSKTKTQQQVPIPHRLVPYIRQLIREANRKPLFWRMVTQDLNRRWVLDDLPAAGIPRVTDEGVAVIHSLRHGGATELLKQGVSVLLVQKMGGWKSSKMLESNYAHLSPVQQRSAIDRVFNDQVLNLETKTQAIE